MMQQGAKYFNVTLRRQKWRERELMELVNKNRRKCDVLWKKLPEQYFTEQLDCCVVLILQFVYMTFGLQIFVCRLDQFQPLMIALDYSQITASSTALSNYL